MTWLKYLSHPDGAGPYLTLPKMEYQDFIWIFCLRFPIQSENRQAYSLTDSELIRWQKSNPIAYANWFQQKMVVVFNRRKAALAESLKANIEDVPDWQVKTPLQRAVQILKRHRDIHFQKRPELKPVSIILTTLAAHAYQNQEDLFEALTEIAKRMPAFIEERNGAWWVQNPVDPDENFADKWNQYPERRKAFTRWLVKVEEDFRSLSKAETLNAGLVVLEESIGGDIMARVRSLLGVQRGSQLPASPTAALVVPGLGDCRHAEKSRWPMNPQFKASVSAGVYFKKGKKKGRLLWPLRDKPVPKNLWLRFKVQTNAPEPYSVRWQVVNTGKEAFDDGQLRGNFYESESTDKGIRWESTQYRGTHWVEAYVVKAGSCVAKSGKFYVKIR